MSEGFPRGKAAIVGAATYGIGEAPGLDSIDLAVHASVRALAAARLTPQDVDGLFVCLPSDFLSGLSLAEYLGIRPKFTDNNRTGGSAFLSHVYWAAHALAAGACDVALIAYGSNQRSGAGKLVSAQKQPWFEARYKPVMPVGAYALAASRHMHEFGTTREQLAEVAVAARGWAQKNRDRAGRTPHRDRLERRPGHGLHSLGRGSRARGAALQHSLARYGHAREADRRMTFDTTAPDLDAAESPASKNCKPAHPARPSHRPVPASCRHCPKATETP